jgi:diguanylate cyclase (GGDEF)-like protein
MSPTLNTLVTGIAGQLMAAHSDNAVSVSDAVLADLAAFLRLDVAFLRHNDHEIRATKLIAQWPVREHVPDPDPIGVVYFADADPVFASAEHLKEPLIIRPIPDDEYQRTIQEGTSVPQVSVACVPLLSENVTTGVLGFIKYGDREWLDAEMDALKTIATLFAQLQGRLAAEQQLRFLAGHDDLTGLCNRRSLMEHLERLLRAGTTGPVAVLFMDVDRLKAINDYLGHASGDRFLATVAARVREAAGPDAMAGRLGGDEFVVIPRAPTTVEEARSLAERLRARFREGLDVDGQSVSRTVSVGVAVGIPDIHTADDLVTYADQAVRSAKSAGGNMVAVFTHDLALKNDLRNDIELHLADGISNDALTIHYLPEVDLRTAEIVAVEALVRWNHPVRGLLFPDAFIAVAESCGLASALGRLVLRSAVAQLKRWRGIGLAERLVMRVNVSPAQLVVEGFAESVAETISTLDIDADSICLEITESLIVDDIETVNANMAALKAVGVKLAIDDFGTGYSAMSRLKALPVDTLKLDRSFVRDLGRDEGDLAIVRAVVALAEAFGLDVVAEGLETELAAETLVSIGCFHAQGYLLSRPIDGMAMQKLLTDPYLPLPSASSRAPQHLRPEQAEGPVRVVQRPGRR